MSMLHREARDKLLEAAAEVFALEHSPNVTEDKINHADVSFDLRARLYVEAIGPRETEPPERTYGQASVKDAEEEE